MMRNTARPRSRGEWLYAHITWGKGMCRRTSAKANTNCKAHNHRQRTHKDRQLRGDIEYARANLLLAQRCYSTLILCKMLLRKWRCKECKINNRYNVRFVRICEAMMTNRLTWAVRNVRFVLRAFATINLFCHWVTFWLE